MSDEQARAERIVRTMLERDQYSRWLGITLLDIRPRSSTVEMTVREEMVNGFGVSHGGVVYSLADTALAFASNTHGRVTVSIDNAISYPAAVHVGDRLVAHAEEERATARLAWYRVTVRRGDDIVALFRGTVYRTNNEFFETETGTA